MYIYIYKWNLSVELSSITTANMLGAARNHLWLLRVSRRRPAAAELSTSGGRAIATSPQADHQEGKNNKSTWTKMKLFFPPALFFCAGTDRVFSLREKTELVEQWESRLKMEVLKSNEIDACSNESLKPMDFRKVECKGVSDEKKMILVLENTPTPSDPFAYEYSLLTPFIQIPAHPQSRSVLVNRGRVPRHWADYRNIEKFQSHEIVRDFPQKKHLSSVSQPQPVKSFGVIIRNIILKLQKHFSSGPGPVEFVGVIRNGVYSEWLSRDVGTLARAVGLDPEATLYVEQIEDMSSDDGGTDIANTVATPYRDADMLARFALMRKEHIQMMILWYCCSAGTLYLARWLKRNPL